MSAEDFVSFLSLACPQTTPGELQFLRALSDKDKLVVASEGEINNANDTIECRRGKIKRVNAASPNP